jgi:hypothetical protein
MDYVVPREQHEMWLCLLRQLDDAIELLEAVER